MSAAASINTSTDVVPESSARAAPRGAGRPSFLDDLKRMTGTTWLLGVFIFMQWFKPSEPFLVDVLTNSFGFSQDAIFDDIFPYWTYSNLVTTLLIGLVYTSVSPAAALLVTAAGSIATPILTFVSDGPRYWPLLLSEITASCANSVNFVAPAFIFQLNSGNVDEIRRASSLVSFATLAGNVTSALLGQLMASFQAEVQTFYVSIAAVALAFLIAVVITIRQHRSRAGHDASATAVATAAPAETRPRSLREAAAQFVREFVDLMRIPGLRACIFWSAVLRATHSLILAYWQSGLEHIESGDTGQGIISALAYLFAALAVWAPSEIRRRLSRSGADGDSVGVGSALDTNDDAKFNVREEDDDKEDDKDADKEDDIGGGGGVREISGRSDPSSVAGIGERRRTSRAKSALRWQRVVRGLSLVSAFICGGLSILMGVVDSVVVYGILFVGNHMVAEAILALLNAQLGSSLSDFADNQARSSSTSHSASTRVLTGSKALGVSGHDAPDAGATFATGGAVEIVGTGGVARASRGDSHLATPLLAESAGSGDAEAGASHASAATNAPSMAGAETRSWGAVFTYTFWFSLTLQVVVQVVVGKQALHLPIATQLVVFGSVILGAVVVDFLVTVIHRASHATGLARSTKEG